MKTNIVFCSECICWGGRREQETIDAATVPDKPVAPCRLKAPPGPGRECWPLTGAKDWCAQGVKAGR